MLYPGNPNAPAKNGSTPSYIVVEFLGYTEIVKFLAPVTKNPNAPVPEKIKSF